MSINVKMGPNTYPIPQTNDVNWGTAVTNYLVAVSQYCLQATGGTFNLTAPLNLGSNFELQANFQTLSSDPSLAGALSLAANDSINWLNQAGTADNILSVNSSNELTFNGNVLTTASGFLTSISTGTGLTGGPITTTGTVSMDISGVTPGTYGNGSNIPQLIVDALGRVTHGTNISISAGTGTITSIVAGSGLSGGTISSTGTVAIANTGVSAGTYTNATVVVNAQGQVTAAGNGTGGAGGVSSISTGTGLVGTTITSSGVIAMGTTGVTPGTYNLASVVVDALGRVTSASSGTGVGSYVKLLGTSFTAGSSITVSGLNGTTYSRYQIVYTNLATTVPANNQLFCRFHENGGNLTNDFYKSNMTSTQLVIGSITGPDQSFEYVCPAGMNNTGTLPYIPMNTNSIVTAPGGLGNGPFGTGLASTPCSLIIEFNAPNVNIVPQLDWKLTNSDGYVVTGHGWFGATTTPAFDGVSIFTLGIVFGSSNGLISGTVNVYGIT